MKQWLTIGCLLGVFLSGCGLQVVPRAIPGVEIDPKQNSATVTSGQLTVTAKVQDLELGPYTGHNNITSFYVVVANRGPQQVAMSQDAFVLLDEQSQQFRALTPDKVQAFLKTEANYLIPYPYVGFYYLQDKAQYDFSAETASSLPYVALNRPGEIAADALPVEAIRPGAKIAGMLYFNIDLYLKKEVVLKIRLPDGSELSLPFLIQQ